MVSSAQMIITRWGEDEAVSLSSPQLPGIVAAFDEDPSPSVIFEVAKEAGLAADGDFEVHVETAFVIEDVTYFIRMRQDFRSDGRASLCEEVFTHLHNEKSLREYVDIDRFGDGILICALPTDTLRKTMATALPHQPVTLASIDESDSRVTCFGIVLGSAPGEGDTDNGGTYLSDYGLSMESTIGEIVKARANSKALLHV